MGHDDALAGLRIVEGFVQDPGAFRLGILEVPEQLLGVRDVEVPARILFLGLPEDIAVLQRDRRLRIIEGHLHHVVDAEDIHGQPFQPIGQLARDRMAIVAAHLLEIGELADFHAVAPHLPAQTPGAQGWALPVVLHEADVMKLVVDPDGAQAAKIQLLQVWWAGLYDDLILVVVLQPVWVLTVPSVGRTARWLHVGRSPGPGPKRPQGRRRMKGPRTDLHVVGLQDRAALP